MTTVKLSQLTELTTPSSNTEQTFLLVTDTQSGSPISKRMSVKTLDTLIDVTQAGANSAYNQANAAFIAANAAFDKTNTAAIAANTPSHVANSASIYANAAFDAANAATATDTTQNNSIDAAFVHANAAFIQANTPSDVANSAAIYANGAFVAANTAEPYTAANLSTDLWATSPPATLQAAIERLANVVIVLNGYTPIP